VYPALAVMHELKKQYPTVDVKWVGSDDGMEQSLVKQANLPYYGISTAGLRGKNPIAFVMGLFKLWRGYWQSRHVIRRCQPNVLFVTGGYVCVPITLAAYHMGIPVLIYLPDIVPGQAVKFLSRFAVKIAVTAEPTQAFFPHGKSVVTGYPIRPELHERVCEDKKDSRKPFMVKTRKVAKTRKMVKTRKVFKNLSCLTTLSSRLHDDLPVLLVFGGSRGARSINKAITQQTVLQTLLAKTQIIHISGQLDKEWTHAIRQKLPESLRNRYHLYAYLHEEMPYALACADVVISRAGASILGEFTILGLPSILVPYPYSGAHQFPNAHYLEKVGAAVIVTDDMLEETMVKTVLDLLNDKEKRLAMGQAAKGLAQPNASLKIVQLLEEVVYVRCN